MKAKHAQHWEEGFRKDVTLCYAKIGKKTLVAHNQDDVTCEHCLRELGVTITYEPEDEIKEEPVTEKNTKTYSEYELKRRAEKKEEMFKLFSLVYYVIKGENVPDADKEGIKARIEEKYDEIDNL